MDCVTKVEIAPPSFLELSVSIFESLARSSISESVGSHNSFFFEVQLPYDPSCSLAELLVRALVGLSVRIS